MQRLPWNGMYSSIKQALVVREIADTIRTPAKEATKEATPLLILLYLGVMPDNFTRQWKASG